MEYEKTDLSELYHEPENEYDTESSDELTPAPDEYATDSDGETTDDVYDTDPSDEQAATCDCGEPCNDCALDDYEIISDVLGCEKQLVKLYSTALCESAEEPLRDIIKENLIECAADQFSAYEYMQKRGMYPVEQAPEDKIVQAKVQFGTLCDN